MNKVFIYVRCRIFLTQQFQLLQQSLEDAIPPAKKAFLQQFYSQVIWFLYFLSSGVDYIKLHHLLSGSLLNDTEPSCSITQNNYIVYYITDIDYTEFYVVYYVTDWHCVHV